jgi:hypothetical protein
MEVERALRPLLARFDALGCRAAIGVRLRVLERYADEAGSRPLDEDRDYSASLGCS